jgi:hypothetical protein
LTKLLSPLSSAAWLKMANSMDFLLGPGRREGEFPAHLMMDRMRLRAMAKRASDSPQYWAALNTISNGRIAPVAGGVLVLHEGQVSRAVCMTGDVSD